MLKALIKLACRRFPITKEAGNIEMKVRPLPYPALVVIGQVAPRH